jgi:uncharacterized protein (TIGR02646 family)
MHKLDRTKVTEPACLKSFDYNTQAWKDFKNPCRRTVRLALQRIQGQQHATDDFDDEAEVILGLRCAYCESQIFFGGHMEHFRRKNQKHFPELTFEWTNLFLACGSTTHCGHYKDRPGAARYNPDELIKPDEHDPDMYLYFHSSGEVRVRNNSGLPPAELHRGSETIRVFNLKEGTLCAARRAAISKYKAINPGILDLLMESSAEDRQEYIQMEIEATQWEPYSTTIRHFLEKAL